MILFIIALTKFRFRFDVNEDAAVAEHDGNFGANDVTGSGSDGTPHSDENEKPSSVERGNGEEGQKDESQRFDSREEKEFIKVLDISLPPVSKTTAAPPTD